MEEANDITVLTDNGAFRVETVSPGGSTRGNLVKSARKTHQYSQYHNIYTTRALKSKVGALEKVEKAFKTAFKAPCPANAPWWNEDLSNLEVD